MKKSSRTEICTFFEKGPITKRLQMKIVVFPLNCLILMEQGTRSDLGHEIFPKIASYIYITYHVCH